MEKFHVLSLYWFVPCKKLVDLSRDDLMSQTN